MAQGGSCPDGLVHMRAGSAPLWTWDSGPAKGCLPLDCLCWLPGWFFRFHDLPSSTPHYRWKMKIFWYLEICHLVRFSLLGKHSPKRGLAIVGRGALGRFSLVLISLQMASFWEGLRAQGAPWVALGGEGPPRVVWEELGVKCHPRCVLLDTGGGTSWGLCSSRGLLCV